MTNSSLCLFWRDRSWTKKFKTGISIHSHTQHSKERLSFIPKILSNKPGFHSLFKYIERRHQEVHGAPLDYSRGYWTPPLSAHDAFLVERGQIEEKLGLPGLVSISDHDSMEANLRLRLVEEDADVPISDEWSVPYGPAVFHVGVHNIPPQRASEFHERFESYRACRRPELLAEILSDLNSEPEILVILNLPLTDEGRIGSRIHERHLQEFLGRFGRWIHALELNTLQPWKDNMRVCEIAKTLDLPVISGGDRHAVEPNGNLNLTNATTFSEFVREVREDRVSNVLFMPQCRESLKIRYIESIYHIVRDYPECPGRVHLLDRVFYELPNGETQTVSQATNGGGPAVTRLILKLVGVVVSPRLRPALRLAFQRGEEVTL